LWIFSDENVMPGNIQPGWKEFRSFEGGGQAMQRRLLPPMKCIYRLHP
jgi:hypothetical protein